MKVPFRFFLGVLLLTLAIAAPGYAQSREGKEPKLREICAGRVYLRSAKKIKFTPLEKTFLCGDPKVKAWEYIPLAQAKFHMRTFLQERGYFNPIFGEEGMETLVVTAGEPTRVTSWSVEGAPPELKVERRRQVRGRLLTPKFLNELEAWVAGELSSQGYPCPKVESRAQAVTGEIVISVEAGPRQKIASIDVQEVEKMHPSVLRRYDAFRLDRWYNEDFLELSSRRIEDEGLLQSTYFTAACGEEGAELTQRTLAGKPRLVHVGFGVNTEGLVLVRSSWRHTRLGSKASSLGVSLDASYKVQTLQLDSMLYLLKPGSRWHLLPVITFSHERESQYHFLSGNARMGIARTWDTQDLGMRFTAGPALNYVYTIRGAEPGWKRLFPLQYEFELKSHYFEYYTHSPRTGFRVAVDGDFNHSAILSEFTAQRVNLQGAYLYNYKNYDPPLWVFGVRGGIQQTFVSEDAEVQAQLPPNYRFYLGGSTDLRGFGRRELPDENGALSTAFVGLEARLAYWIPHGFQPFAFFDAGIVGRKALNFDWPVYFSPGLGLRYESPFGIFRATAAHGFKAGEGDGPTRPTHWQFYFSFGEEF